MKRNTITLILVALIAGLMAPAAFADDNDILRRIDKKLLPESYESYRQLIDEYPDGKKKEFTVYSIKKGSEKTATLFLAPTSEKGRTTLRLGENMWLLIPNVGKPVRITSLQSITGGVFNNADIMQLEYATEYNVEQSAKDGDGIMLQLRAKNKTVAYDSLKMWATKNDIVTKVECYSAGGMLIKTLEFKNIKDFGNGIVRPAVIETYSPLYKGYKSSMIYGQITPRTFKDEAFTLNFMSQIGSLRK
ncbi:MAG: outer membrane lipoprotein-sorting protein [Treponemataceae bacterium]